MTAEWSSARPAPRTGAPAPFLVVNGDDDRDHGAELSGGVRMRGRCRLLTIEEALRLVLARVRPLPVEAVPLGAAAGRVLAERPAPPSTCRPSRAPRWTGSPARGGHARHAAGRRADRRRRPAPRARCRREAMAIATGGVVPDGADAVVPIEYVVEHDNEIEIAGRRARRARSAPRRRRRARATSSSRPGRASARPARRARGRRDRRGRVRAPAARRDPGDGNRAAPARRAARPGQIYEANGLMLAARSRGGRRRRRLAAVADDEDAHRAALERGLVADVLVTSGGVSVGPHDLVRAIRPSSASRRCSGASRSSRASRSRSACAARRSCSACPETRSRRSWASSSSCARRCSRCRAHARADAPVRAGRLGGCGATQPGRDEFVRARTRLATTGVVLDPLPGQESHMIVRPRGRTRSSTCRAARASSRPARRSATSGWLGRRCARRAVLPRAPSRRRDGDPPAADLHQRRVGDVPVRGEEARVAGLERDDLASGERSTAGRSPRRCGG